MGKKKKKKKKGVPPGIRINKDPDRFMTGHAVDLLRRMAPTLSNEGRRECLAVAGFLDGVEVPAAENPVCIAIPVRQNGEYAGWLQTIAHTYITDSGKHDISAETVFIQFDDAEKREFNAST